MPRGSRGQVNITNEAGDAVICEPVHAHCLLPADDLTSLRDYARATGEGYTRLLERVLREALAPVIRTANESRKEREAALEEKTRRAEELRRLIEESQGELRRLERQTGKRSR